MATPDGARTSFLRNSVTEKLKSGRGTSVPEPKPRRDERASHLRKSVSEKDKSRKRESATLGLSRVRARLGFAFLLSAD
ncbi:hypothetical protein [Paraburkholderia terrae]|uniref:hypothetical protein n=1 Tax=Paraburkholderia terrae TaxID=311230 RepID=UPI0012E0590B|nr:hypothetical protein [Paraburkholderia terrae]